MDTEEENIFFVLFHSDQIVEFFDTSRRKDLIDTSSCCALFPFSPFRCFSLSCFSESCADLFPLFFHDVASVVWCAVDTHASISINFSDALYLFVLLGTLI